MSTSNLSFGDGGKIPDVMSHHGDRRPLLDAWQPRGKSVDGRSVKVLYIAGFGRSGSTLLDRLLSNASNFHSGGEITGIWGNGLVDDRLCSCGVRFSHCPFWHAVGKGSFSSLQSHELDAIVRYLHSAFPTQNIWRILIRGTRRSLLKSAPTDFWDIVRCLYTAMRDVSGRQVLVDSSKLATYLVMLAHVSSVDVHVVHLVRDPRAVAHSWQKPRVADPDGRVSMPYFGAVKSAVLWMIMNGAVEWIALRLGLPYARVRYEDLVRDPARIVEELRSDVLRDAGLELEEVGHLEEEDTDLGVVHSISGNPMRFQQGRIPIAEDTAWKADSLSRRVIVAAITLPLRWRYGYRNHQ